MKSVLLIGATGLIGKNCLTALLAEQWVSTITVLTRRPLEINDKKIIYELVDFDNIEKFKHRIKADVMISAFGTTIKKAGFNKELFYKWEVEYPLNTARIAFANGCKHFIFVSAAGINEDSPVFYSKTKAKMEKLAEEIGFNSLDIFKPSLLLGRRDEIRPAEIIFEKVTPIVNLLFKGPLEKYKPIEARDVALAMVKKAKKPEPGVHRYHWSDIQSVLRQ